MSAIEESSSRVQVSRTWIIRIEATIKLEGRGMIDMRKRFRGNQPIALRKETTVDPETGETVQKTKREPVPMLYAGKPAFETVKPTSGDDIASDP
ncbi:hypothetical protein KEM54_004273 [Ascosphaera aggregata]|nr:hypothetical protein KEM54_004273 [Ascosphaera aggregata]